MKTTEVLRWKNFRDLEPTEKQRIQIQRLVDHFNTHGETYLRKQNTFKYLPEMIKSGVDTAYVERLRKLKKLTVGVTLKKLVLRYGKEAGLEKWNQYTQRQSKTNTFEYKKEKYGWTQKEFDEYNSSRAVTRENMIKKHGHEKGLEVWNNYCQRQSTAGVSLEYFQEKYGEEEGRQKYKEIAQKKSHSYDTYLERYGDHETAIAELEKFFGKMQSASKVSKVSQKFCWDLYHALPTHYQNRCYFHELNKEFLHYDKYHKRAFFYDFVIPHFVAIEFQGDYYHGNPKTYNPNDVLNHFGKRVIVKDLWESDKIKQDIIEAQGYHFIPIWESDYNKSPDQCIRKICEYIHAKSK